MRRSQTVRVIEIVEPSGDTNPFIGEITDHGHEPKPLTFAAIMQRFRLHAVGDIPAHYQVFVRHKGQVNIPDRATTGIVIRLLRPGDYRQAAFELCRGSKAQTTANRLVFVDVSTEIPAIADIHLPVQLVGQPGRQQESGHIDRTAVLKD